MALDSVLARLARGFRIPHPNQTRTLPSRFPQWEVSSFEPGEASAELCRQK